MQLYIVIIKRIHPCIIENLNVGLPILLIFRVHKSNLQYNCCFLLLLKRNSGLLYVVHIIIVHAYLIETTRVK